MDQSRDFIYKALYFLGFSQFNDSKPNKVFYIFRFIYFVNSCLTYIALVWSIFDSTTKFVDKIYLLSVFLGMASVDWQYWIVWRQSDDIKELFDWVLGLYKKRKIVIVEKVSRPGYLQLEKWVKKCIR